MGKARNIARLIINNSGAVDSTNLTNAVPADGSITSAKIADGTIATADIANGAITTAKIADANVTVAKISATGTPGDTTFLRGDGAWQTAGGQVDIQTFNSSGTWTKPAFGYWARIQVWGGGGGGFGQGSSWLCSGGGGGGYNETTVLLSTLASTISVTVGAGGNGDQYEAYLQDGGDSSFGTLIYAYGGSRASTRDGGTIWVFAAGGGGPVSKGTRQNSGGASTDLRDPVFGRPTFGANKVPMHSLALAQHPFHGGMSYQDNSNLVGRGGDAIWGGGAGAPKTTDDFSPNAEGGKSIYGGNGGSGGKHVTAGNGVQPGGGGGSGQYNGGHGAAGRVIVTVW